MTTGVISTPAVTTTVPAMTAMAPILPAVALGIVKAIFISKLSCVIYSDCSLTYSCFADELIKAMKKPRCYGYNCRQEAGYSHGHHGMKRFLQEPHYRPSLPRH